MDIEKGHGECHPIVNESGKNQKIMYSLTTGTGISIFSGTRGIGVN